MDFSENDWNHMHDCVYHVTKIKHSLEELEAIYSEMPDELKEDALEFGMSDTLWRDNFIEWYELNN
jgi:hypothetical protein